MTIWKKIKNNFSTASTLEEIYKKYPVLKATQIHGDAIECYALFESAKWQRNYSLAFIFLTFILVLTTVFYSYQTYNLNKINYEQFEYESRPYMMINEINIEYLDYLDEYKVNLKVKNIGKYPGITKKITIEKYLDESTFSEESYSEKLLGKEEETIVEFYVTKELFKNPSTIKVILEYGGVGKLSEEEFISKETFFYFSDKFHKIGQENIK